jgi:lipoprotein-releasing system permease protein
LYLDFAWRYFRAKKSANAINIIAWVTTAVIAFATCCQILVLSVYNGFEDLVKSMYSTFYSDVKIIPSTGKTFTLTTAQINTIKSQNNVVGIALIVEEKTLIKNGDNQTVATLKGVDDNYKNISSIAAKTTIGKFDVGTLEEPKLVVGYGVQNAAGINVSEAIPSTIATIILPKKTTSITNDDAISEGNATATGVFAIQKELDDVYTFTNLAFMQQQMAFAPNEYTAIDIKLKDKTDPDFEKENFEKLLGKGFAVKTRFEQNPNLYNTLRMEKWAVYFVLTLILIIASFNMVSALTMLVLEKQKDIYILRSMGTSSSGIQKIFLTEGLLLGFIGAGSGILLALLICFLQIKFHLITMGGGAFVVDYFPVKLLLTDFLLVAAGSIFISFSASWFPAKKAADRLISLK